MDDAPSWYLDPLVARQKREVHQRWIRNALAGRRRATVLKTDVFEEAWGEDRIYNDLFPDARLAVGMDLNLQTVRAAAARNGPAFRCIACDARRLPLRSDSVDIVLSMSTLDHFDSRAEIARALDEIARVLRPDGALAITFDNPRNPGYHFVRWMSRRGWTPFLLGETVSLRILERMLAERGLRIESTAYLIHNPRGLSTGLFLALRKLLGRFADSAVGSLLRLFALADRLPTRSFTSCFVGVAAVKE